MAGADRDLYMVLVHTDIESDPLYSIELFGPFTHKAAWALSERLEARRG